MCIFTSIFLCSVLFGVACVLWHPVFCACWCLTGQGRVWESPVYFAVFQCMCILASYFMCSWLFGVVRVFLNLFPVNCAVLRCICTDILFSVLADAGLGSMSESPVYVAVSRCMCILTAIFLSSCMCVVTAIFLCCFALHVYSAILYWRGKNSMRSSVSWNASYIFHILTSYIFHLLTSYIL